MNRTSKEGEPLPDHVFPFKLQEGKDDNTDLRRAEEKLLFQVTEIWWMERYRNFLPESIYGDKKERGGALWHHLEDFATEIKKPTPQHKEALLNYPNDNVGSALAERMRLNYQELGLLLLGINLDGQLSFTWWKPKEIIEKQVKLGMPEESIEVAKSLARYWRVLQKPLKAGLVPVNGSILRVD